MGESGSVAHGFERLGLIIYKASIGDSDTVLEAALEAGAEDLQSNDETHEIWTAADDLHVVAGKLEKTLGEPEDAKLAWRPNVEVTLDDKDASTLLKLIDTLDDNEDVQTVWGNYDVPEAIMERLS